MGDTINMAPSVQELVKHNISKVPQQYLQLNQDPVVISDTTTPLPQLPVIELSKLLCEDATEIEKLDRACKEWGFFQLMNHGVDPLLIENVKTGIEEFFKIPIEEKKKFWQTPEEMQGFGQLYVTLEEEKLRWGDMFFVKTFPLHTRHPHLIPSIPQPFRDDFENYSLEMKKLSISIMEFMSKALKIKPNELLDLFEDGSQAMRMGYYPPCPQPEHVIGLNPHSDASAITILLEVNQVQGLQIKKDGMWIPVEPLSNAFLVNVGDALEVLTNGIYKSIEHRVTVNSMKERISLAAFHFPRMGGYVGPTPSLVTPETPALFKTISIEDFVKNNLSSRIKGKSYLDGLRI
ncbi:protein SRG1-like [Vicia villosa]|uniref:protein SRG1-like n=1 Tax=Vicia villosa TaxID=3911 RepID=UPI00273B67DD|nr:protein SRG1-like [Vicia villosa]